MKDDLISRKAKMRLIDADSFREWILKQTRLSKSYTLATLDEMPTIDPDPKKGEWILTSEKRPQKQEWVLVTYSRGHYSARPRVYIAVINDFNNFYIEELRLEVEDEKRILAWMPLPEPYEGGIEKCIK